MSHVFGSQKLHKTEKKLSEKELKYFLPKELLLSSKNVVRDPGTTEPGSRRQKRTGSRIRNTAVSQFCNDVACTLSLCVRRWWASTLTAKVISWPSSLSWNQRSGSMTFWCGSGSMTFWCGSGSCYFRH